MKNIIQLAFLSCILFSSSCSAEYQHRTGKDRDLDSVVREFNEKYPSIQALTKEEVKAAVSAMRYIKDESFDEVYPYLEKTVTENLITDGVYISYKDALNVANAASVFGVQEKN